MKVNIKSLPTGYSITNGKVYRDGGSTTGDQSNYGLVQFPLLDNSSNISSPFDSVNYSLSPVPRDEANLEAEKGETVLTDMNNDGDFELYDIPGQRHHKGGTPLNLPPQSFIYSDTSKMKLNKYELAEMNLEFNKKMTPAKISKNYQLNNFIGLLDDKNSDKITRNTADYMLAKNKRSLSQLAFLQEAKKEFDDGVPLAAYPYLTEKGIDPIDFSQKVENISREEAEQKMLMQLPIEERLQLLIAKEQLQEQQQRQGQQNELIKQGQLPPSMINKQAPHPSQDMAMQGMQQQPMHQMPDGTMMPGATHGEPISMPPQGMMPPQQMQQPAMARYGGQISNLYRAEMGGAMNQNSLSNSPIVLELLSQGYSEEEIMRILGEQNNMTAMYGTELPQAFWGKAMDYMQTGLSGVGMIPGIGNIADLANTAISGGRAGYAGLTGDTEGAKKHAAAMALNAVAMIPGVGQMSQAARAAKAGTKGVKGVVNMVKGVGNKALAESGDLLGKGVIDTGKNIVQEYGKKGLKTIGLKNQEGLAGAGFKQLGQLGQGVNLAKKTDFVTGEYGKDALKDVASGKYNTEEYNTEEPLLTDATTTNTGIPGATMEASVSNSDLALQNNTAATVTADETASNIVADASTTDIMNAETEPIEDTAIEEQEMATIDNESYAPQSETEEEEYNPQSMAAWGYELPKAQYGISDIMSRNQDLSTIDSSAETTNETPINSYPLQKTGASYMSQDNIDMILALYKKNLDSTNKSYDNMMLNQINNYKNSYQSPSIEDQMRALGVSGNQQIDDDMVEVWTNHINAGGTPPDSSDINYTEAYKNIHGKDKMPTYKNSNTPTQNITNVYNTPNEKMENLSDSYINEQIMKGYQTSPYPTEDKNLRSQFNKNIPEQKENQLNFDDPNNPYYAGTQWTMKNGGPVNSSIPSFQKGGTITFEGEEYNRRQLRKMKKYDKNKYDRITRSVEGTKGANIINEINKSRVDIEATDESTQYLTSGNQDWNEYYKGEGDDATQFRTDRYNQYLTIAENSGLTPLDEKDFHTNYVEFQNQNRWMNENLTKEELDNPGWDRKNSYTLCGENDTGCIEIDGQKWKKGETKDKNWRYNQAMENANMTAFDQEMIKHMQAGYQGGKMLELSEDERAKLTHEGVGDQTFQGMNISGVDGLWGNTMNRQVEGSQEVTPATQGQACSNADEMQAACAKAGGNWTPFVAEVKGEDGIVTTPSSGCECDKPINVQEKQIVEEKDAPFWLQDEIAIGNALDDKLSLKKRYPWAPFYQTPQIDAVFQDPTREIAAIGEMAAQASSAGTAFGGGAGRALAMSLAAQGQAMKGVSDTLSKVQGANQATANNVELKNNEFAYKTQLLNNAELKGLYDNTIRTDENYDNSVRKVNAKIATALQNGYTNRANTANLNTIYPQFDIDPRSGGFVNVTDPKAFHANANYKDPKTYLENYTATINELKRSGIPEAQWPKYQMPNQTKGQSWAQKNKQAITKGGYQAKRGREIRLAQKGMELKNWFSY